MKWPLGRAWWPKEFVYDQLISILSAVEMLHMLASLRMRALQQLNKRIENQTEREDRKNYVQLVKYYES